MQYIHVTAAYLTTVHQVIMKVFYLHMKRFASPLKCLFLQLIAIQVGFFTRAVAGLPGLCENFCHAVVFVRL